MFDISWGEMLLIGAAALIFIGPKELPATLRALGQMTGKVRRMAGEFRSQFDEAMREADVQSIRKEFDSMNETAQGASTSFNPIETIRNEIKGAVEKPEGHSIDDKDRPSDLAPTLPVGDGPQPVTADAPAPAMIEPTLPIADPPMPVDPAAFDVSPKPAAPKPELAEAAAPAEATPAQKDRA
jgi:sec-independent protein translocase protein TatB